jgi:hypothetical protein
MKLTQTPNLSSSSNTCRELTPLIRNESCAPLCSGSVGVKICVLKLLDDSKIKSMKLDIKYMTMHTIYFTLN